jgi:Holliday junction resolvase RusA-like endonuclease
VSALLVFTVDGPPLPWQRARGNGKQHFTSPKQKAYQQHARLSMRAAMQRGTWTTDERYHVEIVAYVTPKQRGDVDNIAKQLLDSGNRVLWDDDRQVDAVSIRRFVDRVRPRLEVRVRVAADPALEADDIMHGSEARRPPIKWVAE